MKNKTFLTAVMVMALFGVSQAYAGPAQVTESLETYDVYKINEATPGLREVRLGTRLQGVLATGVQSDTVGTYATDNATAYETITETAVNITTGADWGSSTLLDDGYQDQELTFTLVTDGGKDHKISPKTKTGFTDITLSDAGESVTLKYINSTIGWIKKGDVLMNSLTEGVTSITETTYSADNPTTYSSITTSAVNVVTGNNWSISRYLEDGYKNQQLTFTLSTDGGKDFTLTPRTKTGFASVVLDDANDSATIKFVDSTTGWVLVGVNAATIN